MVERSLRIVTAPGVAELLCFAFGLGMSLWLLSHHEPVPIFAGDHSALLAADTFAHGRLANPPHVLWTHFDRPEVLQNPSYVSRFGPLRGLVLLPGHLAGEPLRGACLAFGLAAAAICWMLRAWVGRGWGLVGALLLAVSPSLAWSLGGGYDGSAAGLAAGALVFGALPRLTESARVRDGLWLGIGIALLALDDVALAVAAAIPAAVWIGSRLRAGPAGARRSVLTRGVAPALVVTALAVSFLGYYNLRTTGELTTSPDRAYRAAYAAAPDWILERRDEPVEYTDRVIAQYYGDRSQFIKPYLERRTFTGFFTGLPPKVSYYGSLFCAGALALLLLAVPLLWADPRVRFAAGATAFFAGVVALQTFEEPRLAAPFAAALFVLLANGLRFVWNLEIGPVQIGMVIGTGLLVWSTGKAFERVQDAQLIRETEPLYTRGSIAKNLSLAGQKNGPILMLVQYGGGHAVRNEWVNNGADVDGEPVVWAREFGDGENDDLLAYYADRNRWRLASKGESVIWKPLRDPPKAADGGASDPVDPANATETMETTDTTDTTDAAAAGDGTPANSSGLPSNEGRPRATDSPS